MNNKILETNNIKIAKTVLKDEAEALFALAEKVDEVFNNVVLKICAQKGRVALTGVGKSSHIAKKIASTFSSTGTPSYFIHPTEASHGDLGMIQKSDILIALSRSGESSELRNVIVYCRSEAIPIVAITAFEKSSLAIASDFVLGLPNINEACPLGLAPTSSSVMMLGLGDALASACLVHKNVTMSDFKVFHPAGKLGLNLTRVSDIMHNGDELPLVRNEATLSHAILEMTRCRFGRVGILNDYGRLIGIFTDGDLRRSLDSAELTMPIHTLMVKDPVSLDPDDLVVNTTHIFTNRRIPSAFVCNDGKPIGILHIHDLLLKGFL